MNGERRTWEQQDGEPDNSFARFLAYRNMGPTRSIDKAFASYVENGSVSWRSSGQWYVASSKWNWIARASAYDVHLLSEAGKLAAVAFVNAITAYARRLLEAISDGDIKPEKWADITGALETLAKFIPSETVKALVHADTRDDPRQRPALPAAGEQQAAADPTLPPVA